VRRAPEPGAVRSRSPLLRAVREQEECPVLLPAEVIPGSEAGGDRKKQEDGACVLNREVEYDE
jgi:hypothetical protein